MKTLMIEMRIKIADALDEIEKALAEFEARAVSRTEAVWTLAEGQHKPWLHFGISRACYYQWRKLTPKTRSERIIKNEQRQRMEKEWSER